MSAAAHGPRPVRTVRGPPCVAVLPGLLASWFQPVGTPHCLRPRAPSGKRLKPVGSGLATAVTSASETDSQSRKNIVISILTLQSGDVGV